MLFDIVGMSSTPMHTRHSCKMSIYARVLADFRQFFLLNFAVVTLTL